MTDRFVAKPKEIFEGIEILTMDAKITKARLGHMLSYDWLKIIGMIAAAIVVWVLVFTMTATRMLPSQQFTVINYSGCNITEKFHNRFNATLKNNNRIFSYEVIELSNVDIQSAGEEMASTMMETRLTTDEGDVIFVPDVKNPSDAYVPEGAGKDEKAYYTYLEGFLRRYYRYVDPVRSDDGTGILDRMETYLNGYYSAGYENAESLDKAKLEKDFRARVKGDKRYKTEAQKAAGVKKEIERIQSYREGLQKFLAYEQAGYIRVEQRTVTMQMSATETKDFTGYYSVNICPDESLMGTLKEDVYYTQKQTVTEDGEEKTVTVSSAVNMHLSFLRTPEMQDIFRFESVLYANYLVELHCTALKA